MTEQYNMPIPKVGDPIIWYKNGDTTADGAPALVTAVGFRSVDVQVLYPRQAWNEVHHAADPRVKENQHTRQAGSWDFSPFYKRVERIEQLLRDLGCQMDELDDVTEDTTEPEPSRSRRRKNEPVPAGQES